MDDNGSLVVRRRLMEAVCIGDDIKVRVVETGGTVRLQISAPKSVRVDREEVYKRRKAEGIK